MKMAMNIKLAALFMAAAIAGPASAGAALNADGCVASEIARQAHDIAVNGGGTVELDEAALKALVAACEDSTGTKVGSFRGMKQFRFTVPALPTPG